MANIVERIALRKAGSLFHLKNSTSKGFFKKKVGLRKIDALPPLTPDKVLNLIVFQAYLPLSLPLKDSDKLKV
jgi:hypothetical protein